MLVEWIVHLVEQLLAAHHVESFLTTQHLLDMALRVEFGTDIALGLFHRSAVHELS